MGLRAFHLFFIAVAVVLSAFCAAWAASEYQTARQLSVALFGITATATVLGLIAYAVAFQRKTRSL